MRQHLWDSAADLAVTMGGLLLAALPLWVRLLEQIHLLAATVASVCGAIIAVNGVWRILKRWLDPSISSR